jgi:hypothetical protein
MGSWLAWQLEAMSKAGIKAISDGQRRLSFFMD